MPINRAKNDKRLAPLLDEVGQIYQIKFHRAPGDTWTSQVSGKELHIGYTKAKYYGGALAHELLHGWVQHSGYRRMLKSCSKRIRPSEDSFLLMNCLDNELQHHKFYPRFRELGFKPYEFYCDSDSGVADYLGFALDRNYTDLIAVLPPFFTAIAPGGSLSQEQRTEFEVRFLEIKGGVFGESLKAVKRAVSEWASSPEFDVRLTVAEILHQYSDPCETWIGHSESDEPPDQGFFVDAPFDPAEALRPLTQRP